MPGVPEVLPPGSTHPGNGGVCPARDSAAERRAGVVGPQTCPQARPAAEAESCRQDPVL